MVEGTSQPLIVHFLFDGYRGNEMENHTWYEQNVPLSELEEKVSHMLSINNFTLQLLNTKEDLSSLPKNTNMRKFISEPDSPLQVKIIRNDTTNLIFDSYNKFSKTSENDSEVDSSSHRISCISNHNDVTKKVAVEIGQETKIIHVSGKITIRDFKDQLKDDYYIKTNFKIILKLPTEVTMNLEEHLDKTIDSMFESAVLNRSESDCKPLTIVVVEEELSNSFKSSDYNRSGRRKKYEYNHIRPLIQSSDESLEYNYVGLVNQAMTCYLNSLLQALYMTPEFRNAMYNWEFTNSSEKDENFSIPYQLQKLFLNLQTSLKPAVETTSLTRSFGWDSSEAWHQHDIQELCRVMFDALEKNFKNTAQADLINRLYEGKMIDYIKCLSCGTEKTRDDTFLDIPLPIKPFGDNEAYDSVIEALKAFVKCETLDGNNQYFCEKCNTKCDAQKGLKFKEFPYILTLHLKRFDFDYQTCHRIKLNDKVTFPDELDINFLISSNFSQVSCPNEDIESASSIKCDDSSTTDSGTLDDECIPCESNSLSQNNILNNHHEQDIDEGIDVSTTTPSPNCIVNNHSDNEKIQENGSLTPKGPYVYELFSIMIHSGSASGGHYYAYIKDFRNNKWMCFNDQSVYPINRDHIEKTYGGGLPKVCGSSVYRSSTNAYMLMYRQVDLKRNKLPMDINEFPPHIQELLNKIREQEEKLRREQSYERTTLNVYHNCHNEDELKYEMINACEDWSLDDIKDYVHKALKLEGKVSKEQCRIVNFNKKYNIVRRSHEGKENKAISEIRELEKDLFLDIRKENEEFENYNNNEIVTKVYLVDIYQRDIIDGPKYIRAYGGQPAREYKQNLKKYFHINPNKVFLVSFDDNNKPFRLGDDKSFSNDSDQVYKIIVSETIDIEPENLQMAILSRISEEIKDLITFHIKLPDINEEILKKHDIPSLESYKKKELLNESYKKREVLNDNKTDYKSQNYDRVTKYIVDTINRKQEASDKSYSHVHSSATREFNGRDLDYQSINNRNIKTNGDPYYQPEMQKNIRTSVDLFHQEQNNSEDSSLSDSDKTLVDGLQEDFTTELSLSDTEKIDETESGLKSVDSEGNNYIKITTVCRHKQKQLKVHVSDRVSVNQMKEKLEKYLEIPKKFFTISPDIEGYYETFEKSVSEFIDEKTYVIKLGRVLDMDEFQIQVHLLELENSELSRQVFSCYTRYTDLVKDLKKDILEKLDEQYQINMNFDSCRLIFFDRYLGQILSDDRKMREVWDMAKTGPKLNLYVQQLNGVESIEDGQNVVFVAKWSENIKLWDEIILPITEKISIEETLKEKISDLGNLPLENIQFVNDNSSYNKNFNGIIYRDSTDIIESHKDVGFDRKEITFDKYALNYGLKSNSITAKSMSSPRREKALRINVEST